MQECRRHGFNPWVRKIPWRRKWQPTPVFLPGESHGQRSSGGSVHGVAKSQIQLKWLSTQHAQIIGDSARYQTKHACRKDGFKVFKGKNVLNTLKHFRLTHCTQKMGARSTKIVWIHKSRVLRISGGSWYSLFFFFFTLQYCIGFAIHQHASTTVYMCSPSWTPLPPPSPYHPSGSSQCASLKFSVSCIEPGLGIHFLYDIIHVLMPFSQIIPLLTLPQSPKDCSIHLCLFCCLIYRVVVTIFLNSIYMC